MFEFIGHGFTYLVILFFAAVFFNAMARERLRKNDPEEFRRRDAAMKGHAMTAAKWAAKRWLK